MSNGCPSFEAYVENHSRWYGCSMLFSARCLPFGKADDTASPALSRIRHRLTTASPLTPRICGILNFHNTRIKLDIERSGVSLFKPTGTKFALIFGLRISSPASGTSPGWMPQKFIIPSRQHLTVMTLRYANSSCYGYYQQWVNYKKLSLHHISPVPGVH